MSPVTAAAAALDVTVVGQGMDAVVAWEDYRSGQSQVYLATSDDGGVSWGADQPVGLDWPQAPESQGGNPSLAFGPAGEVFVGYEHAQTLFLGRSLDGAATFEPLYVLGEGRLVHLEVAPGGHAVAAWEQFQGDPDDDSIKTAATAFSPGAYETLMGPHFVPDTADGFGATLVTAAVSDLWLDILWIDNSGDVPILRHRSAETP